MQRDEDRQRQQARLIAAVETAISQWSSVWAVARDTGIPRATLTSRLKGETPFYVGELGVIAEALNVPVESLFPAAS